MALRTLTITLVDFGLVAAANCRVHIEQLRAGKDSGSIVIPTVRFDGRTNNAGLLTVQLLPNDNHSRYHVKIYNAAGSVATKGYFDMPDSNASLADIIVFEDNFTGTAATAELIKKLTMRGDWDVTDGDGLPAAVRNDAVRLVNVPSVGAPVVEGRTVVNGQTVYFDATGTWRSLSHRLITGFWDMTGAAIACTYAFNSLDADVTDFGYAGAVVMAGQTGSITTAGGLGSQVQRLSTSAVAQTVNFAAGKKVVETLFTSSHAALSGGVNGAAISVRLLDSATFAVVAVCGIQITSSGLDVVVGRAGAASEYQATLGGLSAVVGLEFNSATGIFRAIINGTAVELFSGVYVPGTCLLAIESIEGAGIDAGVTLSAAVRTSETDFTQTYAVDATDICNSESVGGDATLPEGAQPEDVYEVSVAGTYEGVDFSIGDLAMVRTDGVSVTRIGPGTNGTNGTSGWTEVPSIASDGERRVIRIVDYVGGTGTKPATGKYLGAAGLVDLIADGVDIRGAAGSGSSDPWTYVKLVSNVVVTNFTPSGALTFSLAANTTYEVEAFGVYTSSVTTSGVLFQPIASAGTTDIYGHGHTITSTSGGLNSIGAQTSGGGMPSGTTTTFSVGSGSRVSFQSKYLIKTGATAPTITFNFAGETSGPTHTLYGGLTYAKFRELP